MPPETRTVGHPEGQRGPHPDREPAIRGNWVTVDEEAAPQPPRGRRVGAQAGGVVGTHAGSAGGLSLSEWCRARACGPGARPGGFGSTSFGGALGSSRLQGHLRLPAPTKSRKPPGWPSSTGHPGDPGTFLTGGTVAWA